MLSTFVTILIEPLFNRILIHSHYSIYKTQSADDVWIPKYQGFFLRIVFYAGKILFPGERVIYGFDSL